MIVCTRCGSKKVTHLGDTMYLCTACYEDYENYVIKAHYVLNPLVFPFQATYRIIKSFFSKKRDE